MKSFKKKLAYFLLILFLLMVTGILLPPTPKAATSHLFSKLQMDSLLQNVDSPRLILVGGSNLSLSINSQLLKDSLRLNPINTAISWATGFFYMFDNTLKYVRPGDIVLASIEYHQFYHGNVFGAEDLAITVLDVSREDLFRLNIRQYYNMMPSIPYHAFSKFNPGQYFFTRNPGEIYDRNATNQFGDNCKHWSLPSREVPPLEPLPEEFDPVAFDVLTQFETAFQKKGATLLITFPALQKASFEIQRHAIRAIEDEYVKRKFRLVGSPERYIMPDSLLFDTPYHLIKPGVDLRTQLLIEDLKSALPLQYLNAVVKQTSN